MRFEVYVDKANELRWSLKADNGEPIADSAEGYRNRADLEHAIGLIKNHAPTAVTVDLGRRKVV